MLLHWSCGAAAPHRASDGAWLGHERSLQRGIPIAVVRLAGTLRREPDGEEVRALVQRSLPIVGLVQKVGRTGGRGGWKGTAGCGGGGPVFLFWGGFSRNLAFTPPSDLALPVVA